MTLAAETPTLLGRQKVVDMQEHDLRIIISKEEDMFVAQCLEHDVCVQAPDITTLQRRFAATLLLEGDISQLPPAPQEFHRRWEEGFKLQAKLDNADVRLAA